MPQHRDDLYRLIGSQHLDAALSFDLSFPEVFYPTGVPYGRKGFHAVLGNPPWDRMLPADKEFFAAFDFTILDAPTRREREGIQASVLNSPIAKQQYERYIAGFRDAERAIDTLYKFQVAVVNGERTIGKQDAFRAFMERNSQLLRSNAWTGVVVPSAFHANEGATGIRRLYLEHMELRRCFSFEKRRKLFEIDSRFKFATIVAKSGAPTSEVECAFYLHDDDWLFGKRDAQQLLVFTLNLIRQTGGDYLSLVELRSARDLEVAKVCFANGVAFGTHCSRVGVKLGRELNMTDDSWRFTPTSTVLPTGVEPRDSGIAMNLLAGGYVVLHEGKTFWHFSDLWGEPPRYLVALSSIQDRPVWIRSSQYFRLAFRDIASATNERTVVFSLLPPLTVVGNTAPTERDIWLRATSKALTVLSLANCFTFDWTIRIKAASHVNLFILNSGVLARVNPIGTKALTHNALRLTCNHAGYAPLWQEQLSDAWREPGKAPMTWPVLATDDERWRVRAAIDAVVADAYGLSREQYAHVLSTFSHASYKSAPELCLAAFDELKSLGVEAFTKKHDPYWDIPLNEQLPQPVIDLPLSEASAGAEPAEEDDGAFKLSNKPPKPKRGGRKR